MKPADLLGTIRYLGVYPVIRGGWHRLIKKSGVLKRRFPAADWNELSWSSFLSSQISQNELRGALARTAFFCVRELVRNKNVPARVNDNVAETIQRADEVTKGSFKYFSKLDVQHGLTVNWHLNPFTGAEWPKDAHWFETNYFTKELGDIKAVWEINRFSWVFDLVRAYRLSGGKKYAAVFWELFEDWLENNQPNRGVNWSSGQECALRLMALCFGFFAFFEESTTTGERINKMLLAVGMHAKRIEGFIGHAIRQKTNHALSEAAGLYTVGTVFPFFKKAEHWKMLGKKILEREGLRQIYEDGSYVQHSMNYHRLMLQVYLWCFRLGELNGQEFSERLRHRVIKATEFLYQMQDDSTGRVPNYGPNDGALILPLNSCDYSDYRPVIQACWYFFKREKLYDAGSWDEDILWLFGPEALDVSRADARRASSEFRDGGYYTLRSNNSWAMVRCHSYRDRVGHVDMLHVDLWADGMNLLRDCGTYKYFAPEEPQMEYYFKSNLAHNTVIVDDSCPLRLASRFIWLGRPKAEVLRFEENGSRIEFEGISYVYNRSPWHMQYSRNVRVYKDRESWEITDRLTGRGRHKVELRWHLPGVSVVSERGDSFVNVSLGGDWFLEVACDCKVETRLLSSSAEGGWESLHYGHKEPIVTFSVVCDDVASVEFKTKVRRQVA